MEVETSSVILPDGKPLKVLTIRSGREGPSVVVSANVHGDEATGIGVVHNLARELPQLLRCGQVHLYPTLNPAGLVANSRHLPSDGQDLNRAFPGRSRGSASERHADVIWRDIVGREPAAIIDLHTDAAGSIPYAIVDRVLRVRDRRRLVSTCARLARASGLTVLSEYPKDRYVRYHLERSLPGAAINVAGIPAITLEVGPRRWLDPRAAALTTEAVYGVLTELGLLDRPAPRRQEAPDDGRWRRESGPRTNHTGVLVPLLRPGDVLERGVPIAEVRTIEGTVLETLIARASGFVVSLPERCHVVPGVASATIAVRDH